MMPTPLPQFDFLPLVRDIALLVAFAIGAFYFLKHKIGSRGLLVLSAITGVTLLMYAVSVSLAQYFVWSKDSFTQILLNAPLATEVPASPAPRFVIESIGAHEYFLYYVWGHFLMPAFLVFSIALFWYIALRLATYVRPRLVVSGEPELALLVTLVAPWPYAPFVVPAALLFLLATLTTSTLLPRKILDGKNSLTPTGTWGSFSISLIVSGGFFVFFRVITSATTLF